MTRIASAALALSLAAATPAFAQSYTAPAGIAAQAAVSGGTVSGTAVAQTQPSRDVTATGTVTHRPAHR
ncbi:hypothetical protein [Methylobacterium organophilum]|uniref:Uncharacterized protein n=1 Tax=Methylobacterium organophilum TaxID=410 RepID=A0ABQ4T7E6_METOR|nr:hypothetical protein [Methylobacterium organophilum]GJE27253.1 hypothetical protein LKMONMHP_2111 [Methylobacterium organophilum]